MARFIGVARLERHLRDAREGGLAAMFEPQCRAVASGGGARARRHLQAAAAHPVGHGVHVDALGDLGFVSLGVAQQRHADLHVAAPPLPDVAGQRVEARGGKDDRVGHHRGGGIGWQKSPTPIIGNAGIVTTASSGPITDASRFRRSTIDASTRRRSAVKPPYGRRGVPSIIHAPYSGCHEAPSPKPSRRP
eukprot:scaffold5231_cov119-Isochrysis_galbana.AAC.6